MNHKSLLVFEKKFKLIWVVAWSSDFFFIYLPWWIYIKEFVIHQIKSAHITIKKPSLDKSNHFIEIFFPRRIFVSKIISQVWWLFDDTTTLPWKWKKCLFTYPSFYFKVPIFSFKKSLRQIISDNIINKLSKLQNIKNCENNASFEKKKP